MPSLEVKRNSDASLPSAVRNGVLMVMMENYADKSVKFLENGQLAVGIKWTKDSMEIVENIKSIGYVLFHHRSNTGQHLFAVNRECEVLPEDEVGGERYKTIREKEMYVVVDLDTSMELDATALCSTLKNYTQKTRYDAQFAWVEDLRGDK